MGHSHLSPNPRSFNNSSHHIQTVENLRRVWLFPGFLGGIPEEIFGKTYIVGFGHQEGETCLAHWSTLSRTLSPPFVQDPVTTFFGIWGPLQFLHYMFYILVMDIHP